MRRKESAKKLPAKNAALEVRGHQGLRVELLAHGDGLRQRGATRIEQAPALTKVGVEVLAAERFEHCDRHQRNE